MIDSQAMKIILSRKGFDSSSGGCPNPILPDGRLVPLPIPDEHSPVRYADLPAITTTEDADRSHDTIPIGNLVTDLTGNRLDGNATAHLDPDIDPGNYPRKPQWRPLFGQSGAAQGHLAKQGVGAGDLFLFFGLFQPVEFCESPARGGHWRFCRKAPKRHVFWGWLQVEQHINLEALNAKELEWARYHPHFYGPYTGANHLYIAREKLRLGRGSTLIQGAGVFHRYHPSLSLTAPEVPNPSQWLLPHWFQPEAGQSPLSYHNQPWRWRRGEQGTHLQSVARGQEFVLDASQYPEAKRWALSLIKSR